MRKSYQELKKLEDACKILLEKDKIKTKDELEILIDTSEEIVLAKNVIDKKRDGKITKVNQGYLNKEIERCENCVFILATNGKIKTLNKKMSLLLGYKKEDFDRISVKSIFPLTEKETISKHRSDIDHLRSIFCDRKKYNLPPAETSVLDKKNKLIPFQVKAIELKNDKDELVNILFLLKDIRARKRKEDEVNKKRDELIKQIEKFGGLEIIEELKKMIS